MTFRDLDDVAHDLASRGRRRPRGGDRRRPARARSRLWPREGRRAGHRRPSDGPADGAPARRARRRAAQARGRSQGHRVRLKAETAEIAGERPRRRRRAEGRPQLDADARRGRGRASGRTSSWRARPASRSTAASSSTTRCRRASRGIYAIGECAEHRGICYGLVEPAYEQARVLAAHLAGDATARYGGSVLATNLKVSGVNVFSAGDFLGARRHRRDRALRSGHRRSTRSSSSPTAGSSARCCSAIPPTALWYLDLIR